ncbi:MAG: hypothetical protein ACKVVP_01995 [Chloroflexota bacterium]
MRLAPAPAPLDFRTELARLATGLALAWALLLPSTALASEFRAGDDVRVTQNETIDGDLYIAGSQVTIEGRVNGDLVVVGGTVRITGPVQGSVNAAAGEVSISGPVGGSARLAGGSVTINSNISGDVLAGSGTLTTARGSTIGRDLVIGASLAEVNGAIQGQLTGGGETVTLNGSIGRDVALDVNQLAIGAGARIGGDVRYQSANEASIAPAAQISGQRLRTDPPAQEVQQPSPANWVPGFLLSWLMPLVLGGILILLFPTASTRLANQLTGNPWGSLIMGLLVLAITPFVVLLLLITVLGIPAAVALLALYLIALYVSHVVTGMTLGRQMLLLARQPVTASRGMLLAALALGLLLLSALQALPVPVLGVITTLLSLLFGLGALWLGLTRLHAHANQPA